MTRGGVDYFYHTDHQGSVQQLTDATGTVVNSYEYDSYGKLISSFETVSQPYGYTAREQDVESDLTITGLAIMILIRDALLRKTLLGLMDSM